MTLTRIADQMRVEHRRQGDVLTREGTPGNKISVIGEGTAEAIKEDAVVRELGPGDYFGAFTTLSGRLIRETIRARTDLEVYTLTKEGFEKVMETDEGYEQRILALYMTRH